MAIFTPHSSLLTAPKGLGQISRMSCSCCVVLCRQAWAAMPKGDGASAEGEVER